MKLKAIVMTVLAAAVLASCSKDSDESGNKIIEDREARMDLSLTLPVGTRAPGTRADQTATSAESAVNSITVYVFNATTKAGAKDGAFTHFADLSAFDVSGLTYKLKADHSIHTSSGQMKVYIAANLPASHAIAYKTEPELLEAFARVAAMDNSDNATGFTMFSKAEPITLQPYDSSDPSTVGLVKTGLQRVVSKLVASTAKAVYENTWSPLNGGVKFEYEVKGMGVYKDAVESYLVQNPTTLSTLSTHAVSMLRPNAPVTVGHPADADERLNMTGFYIGENIPGEGNTKYGNTTYAMIATVVTIDKAAEWDTTDEKVVYDDVTPYGGGNDDVYLINYNGEVFVTDDSDKASDIVNGIDARDSPAEKAVIYLFPKGWVHFMAHLNRAGTNDYRVDRNQFIHVKVRDLIGFDGGFPGYPGDDQNPEKPVDPTQQDPKTQNTKDPDEMIDPEPARLVIEVTVDPWEYMENDIDLQ